MGSGDPIVNYLSECRIAEDCANNQCMFRLRQVFNHPVWLNIQEDPGGKQAAKAQELAGVDNGEKLGWPTWKGYPGTNVISFTCDWYKPKENGN